MLAKLFTALFVTIFYIIWVPIVLLKDFFSLFYIPFDIERLFKTYQQFMNNLYSMTNFHKQLEEKSDDIGRAKDNNLYKRQNIGFSVDCEEEIEEEIYEE